MDDCYFFLYSSCKFKDKCAYRHNESCRNNLVTCRNWESKIPCREDCPYRHSKFHLKKNRREEMCYWENKPSGCTKDRCEYRHVDPMKDAWKTGESSEKPQSPSPNMHLSSGSERHTPEDTRLKDYEEVMNIQDSPKDSKDNTAPINDDLERKKNVEGHLKENAVLSDEKKNGIDTLKVMEAQDNVLEKSPTEDTQKPQSKRVKTEESLDVVGRTSVNLEELDKEIEELDNILMK
ncbi:hypothetical protein KMI_03g04650 [Encephalitozoon hellem]|nr:hypothetical protein KMI_03g04650 [Encephalitozoon hellem]